MNILLVTSIYPLPTHSNHGTKVCHFFAKEWNKMGHNVRVVHYQAVYPRPFYWVAKLMRNFLAAKTGAVIYTERDKSTVNYLMDNIPVTRIPLYKPIPHGKFSSHGIKQSIKEIIAQNQTENFVPDIIVGHFVNPQCEVLYNLKRYYSNVKTALIFHLPAEIRIAKKVYSGRYNDYINSIDVLGFRNCSLRRKFLSQSCDNHKTFICYSGIPESYITTSNVHRFKGKLRNFIYVGEMIERKFPVKIIDALQIAYETEDYHITYIGNGQQLSVIKDKARMYKIEPRISIIGKIPRDEIVQQYDDAQCMIMISRGEAYGLVYLEAMARGCITIASQNEGMDGVILDGINGFLCEAGNEKKLAEIIKRINSLTEEERMAISEHAIKTAMNLTDYNAAKLYIDDIIRLTCHTEQS